MYIKLDLEDSKNRLTVEDNSGMATLCSCLREGTTLVLADPVCLAPSHLWDQIEAIEVPA